jgi:hypothetical protein
MCTHGCVISVNNVIEDVLGLVLCEALIGSEWWELIKIIVEFDPSGIKLTDHSII